MDDCRVKLDVEELAGAVVAAEADDVESVAMVCRLLDEAEQAAKTQDLIKPVAEALGDVLTQGRALAGQPSASSLQRVAEAVDKLQKQIARCHTANSTSCKFRGGSAKQVVPTPRQPQAPAPAKQRDSDTIAIIGEFLSESEEGLARADQILMTMENAGASADSINSLFRVFHTIKGVAGFLELFGIQSLAHTTESMLNGCRANLYPLIGARLDLVFDATAMMRKILKELAVAVEASKEFSTVEDIPSLVARLQAALDPAFEDSGRKAENLQKMMPSQEDAGLSDPSPALEEVEKKSPQTASEEASAAPPTANRSPDSQGSADTKLRPTIKVDLERVDRLVEMIGELVVVEAMVVGAPEIAHSVSSRVRNCLSQLEKVTHDLQDVGMRMRMLPVSGVFQKMARMARDVGRKAGKQVRVVLSGEQTEMDRSMVEQISDPLVHMIRNSIDHGIEPPDMRRQLGKPEEGKIRLSACHEGGHVVIEISDDGRGLNRDAIVKKAIAQGMISATDTLPENEINALIFAPGFSTAEKVTDISGRGVGMDVVRRNIDAMRGRITIKSVPGQGTTFKIALPLTLAIIDGMLVACGKERYIIPTLSIIESIQPEATMLVTQGGSNEMLNMRGNVLPLLRMDRLLGAEGGIQDPTQGLVVIIEGSGRRVGLLVDEVIAQQQVVIKSMGEGVGEVPFVSGAAILSDGRVGLIVNVEGIVALIAERRHRGSTGDGLLVAVGATNEVDHAKKEARA
jgi:two-component system, chemotaxis family, sensor kinase CheA